MPSPFIPFKAAAAKDEPQLGCRMGFADPYTAEVARPLMPRDRT